MENQQVELSRRNFLKDSVVATIGIPLSAILANAHYLLDAEYNLPPRAKERYLVKTNEGYQVGLLLAQHGGVNPNTGKIEGQNATSIETVDLHQPVGAFFLDTSADYLNSRVTGKIVENSLRRASQEVPRFYRVPVEYGITNDIPFIFGDIILKSVSDDEFVKQSGGDLQRKGYYTALATMLAEGSRQIAKNYIDFFKKGVTRREFLKLLVGGGALSTIYFSSPAYTHLTRSLGIKPDFPVGRDFQAIFTDLIHPNNYPIVMRNVVWALKCRDFYERGIIPKEKVINILGGLAHQFFDFFMRYPGVAKKYWHIFDYGKVAGEFSQGDPTWTYKSLIFYPSRREIKIIEHNSLKDLVR